MVCGAYGALSTIERMKVANEEYCSFADKCKFVMTVSNKHGHCDIMREFLDDLRLLL